MKTVYTSGNEFFYSIPGLAVPKHEVSNILVQDMEYIADWISKNADGLPFLLEHHIEAFIAQMEMLHEIFNNIYAKWLANDTARILQVVHLQQPETCRKLLTPFITDAHTIALDIQMAQKKGETAITSSVEIENDSISYYDKIGRYLDVTIGMKVIAGLLDVPNGAPDFEMISNVAQSIKELQINPLAEPLFFHIKARDVPEIKNALDTITAVYSDEIDAIDASVTKASGRKKILIVDDVPEILSALTLMLEDHYHIFALSDGCEALEFIDSGQSPDAFILDIDMPVMDGFTLAKNIRSKKKYKNTPLLFLTGNSTKETVIKAYQYNVKAFIVKPANKNLIISKLSSCFV